MTAFYNDIDEYAAATLRTSGNAINAEAARVFVQAYDESLVLMELLQ